MLLEICLFSDVWYLYFLVHLKFNQFTPRKYKLEFFAGKKKRTTHQTYH